jgi:Glycosyl hydrolase family 115
MIYASAQRMAMRRIFVFPILLLFFTVACFDTRAFSGDLGGAAAAPRPPSSWRGVATPGAGTFSLPPGVQILVDSSEAGPIQVAVQDLQRDLQRVLGTSSAVVNTASVIAGKPAIVVTCTGAVTAHYRDPSLKSVESHELRAKGSSSAPRMVLEGADTRGTIYAIYEFSNDFLNVPPLWYWSSWQPQAMTQVSFSSSLQMRFGSPNVRWRVWFPNDEDLLATWMNASIANFAVVFETLLRLKYNTLNVNNISNYNNTPNQGLQWARECKRRGIVVTFTHYTPFGADIGDWNNYWTLVAHQMPPPTEFSTTGALTPALTSELQQFWTDYIHLAQSEGFEVIETIVFRGHGDQAFWRVFSNAPAGDAARAEIINQLLPLQVALLKSTWNTKVSAFPLMRTVFYSEVADFMAEGVLNPPAARNLVWTFVNKRRDHCPYADLMNYKYEDHPDNSVGYYMNLQFNSTGSHLAAGEGPWKVELNNRIVSSQAGPGNYVLAEFNVGNIREFAMEISLGGDLLWNLNSYISGGSTVDTALQNFCARYFGKAQAARVASLYTDYYHAYWQQRTPDFPGGFPRQYIFDDLRYARAARDLLADLASKTYQADPFDSQGPSFYGIVPADSGATTEIGAVLNGTTAAVSALKPVVSTCAALLPLLPRGDQPFFNDDMCLQSQFMLQVNLFLQALDNAMFALGHDDHNAVLSNLKKAGSALQAAQASLNQRVQGPVFTGWYANEHVFGIPRLLQTLDSIVAQHRGTP